MVPGPCRTLFLLGLVAAVAAWVADGLDEFAKETAEALTGVSAPKR